jgi:hypothetical protein
LHRKEHRFLLHLLLGNAWTHLTARVGIEWRIYSDYMPGRKRNGVFMSSLGDQSQFFLPETFAHSPPPCKCHIFKQEVSQSRIFGRC